MPPVLDECSLSDYEFSSLDFHKITSSTHRQTALTAAPTLTQPLPCERDGNNTGIHKHQHRPPLAESQFVSVFYGLQTFCSHAHTQRTLQPFDYDIKISIIYPCGRPAPRQSPPKWNYALSAVAHNPVSAAATTQTHKSQRAHTSTDPSEQTHTQQAALCL